MEIVPLHRWHCNRHPAVSDGLSFNTSWLGQNSYRSLDSSQGKLIATDKSSKNRKATSSALNMPTELQRLRGMAQFSRFQDFKGLTAADKPLSRQPGLAWLCTNIYSYCTSVTQLIASSYLQRSGQDTALQHSAAGWGRNRKDTVFLVDLMIRDGIANSWDLETLLLANSVCYHHLGQKTEKCLCVHRQTDRL